MIRELITFIPEKKSGLPLNDSPEAPEPENRFLAGPNYSIGKITASMMWMIPLDAEISGVTILAVLPIAVIIA